ncbi:MAG TPA: TerB family tellurite resistance protein [Hyphomicrobiales bacterium]|nr:TerB family tellurite resistance protein [Hyphomicrobiales bacterium]
MLDRIRQFVADLAVADERPAFAEDDHRVAAAALLVHLMEADGVVAPEEKIALHRLLRERFGLSDADADELAAEGRERDEEAIDLYGFTSILKDHLDRTERLRLIEMMWKMVFADGRVTELEDNIVWRVSELLGISTTDRIALKQRVAAQG